MRRGPECLRSIGLCTVTLAAAALGGTAEAGAQVLRGRITEANTTAPVAGVLVSLLGATTDSALVSVLTTPSGEYAIRAPAPGRYRIAAKRIGVRRHISAPFELADGETRQWPITLDAIALTLPEVTVSGLCVTRARELRRVAALWDEVLTALQATEISRRDRLIQADIVRHASEVDPATMRVLFDWRSNAQLLVEEPFTSLSGDSLSLLGYWRQMPGDSVEFLAPDARALSSHAFLRDHCFTLASSPRNRPDLVGLAFQPARERALSDIAGTIWLDARSYELRSLTFRYTRLPLFPYVERIGGEVHYTRLEGGAWIVDRWFIRMPQVVSAPGAAPRRILREEGGSVAANGRPAAVTTATISGVLRDSTGRPLAGGVVRAIGTSLQTQTDPGGAFQLGGLPPGDVSLVAHAAGYDAHAMLAASRHLTVRPRQSIRVDLRASTTAAMMRELCPAQAGARARGVLRLLMVDSATTRPLAGVPFRVTWAAASEFPGAPSDRNVIRRAVTDARGAATFCFVPAHVPIEADVEGRDGELVYALMTEVMPNQLLVRVIAGRVAR